MRCTAPSCILLLSPMSTFRGARRVRFAGHPLLLSLHLRCLIDGCALRSRDVGVVVGGSGGHIVCFGKKTQPSPRHARRPSLPPHNCTCATCATSVPPLKRPYHAFPSRQVQITRPGRPVVRSPVTVGRQDGENWTDGPVWAGAHNKNPAHPGETHNQKNPSLPLNSPSPLLIRSTKRSSLLLDFRRNNTAATMQKFAVALLAFVALAHGELHHPHPRTHAPQIRGTRPRPTVAWSYPAARSRRARNLRALERAGFAGHQMAGSPGGSRVTRAVRRRVPRASKQKNKKKLTRALPLSHHPQLNSGPGSGEHRGELDCSLGQGGRVRREERERQRAEAAGISGAL